MRSQEDAQRELFEEEQKLSEDTAEVTLLKAIDAPAVNARW